MNACGMKVKEAFDECPALLISEMELALSMHENHARVTSSETAYRAAMSMARDCRAALAHVVAGDIDAINDEMRYYIPASKCAERALLRNKWESNK